MSLTDAISTWSPKEVYALVKQECPFGQYVAPASLALAVVVLWMMGAAIAYDWAGARFIGWASGLLGGTPSLANSAWTWVVVVAVSATTFGAVVWLVVFLVGKSEARLNSQFEANLRPRLEGIFAKLTDLDVQQRERDTRVSARFQMVERFLQIGDRALEGLAAAAPPPPPDDTLTIHFARYGFGDQWADVTEVVRRHIQNNRVEMPVTNDALGCDPYKGQAKSLHVTYSVGGTLRPEYSIHESKKRRPSVLSLPGVAITVPAGMIAIG